MESPSDTVIGTLIEYNIVVTRTGFEWGSQKDVLDLSFLGYFMEETVMELL